MAQLKVKIGDKKFFDAIDNKILKSLSRGNVRKAADSIIRKEISLVVERNKSLFQPSEDAIGKLGIGSDGKQLKDKTQKAWQNLLAKSGGKDTVGRVRTTFARRPIKNFGTVTYTINKEVFYNKFDTKYVGSKNEKVPWMRYFIEGMPTPDGFAYVEKGDFDFRSKTSRTGLGIMKLISRIKIPAKQFAWDGVGQKATYGVLIEKISKSITSNPFRIKFLTAIKKEFNKNLGK